MSGGWLAVRWLHVLAMALFVGGQLVLVVAVIPALRTRRAPGAARDRPALRLGVAGRARRARSPPAARSPPTTTAGAPARCRSSSRWWSASAALIAWHLRRPGAHAIEGLIFLVSLAIVWLGLALAHGPLPFD